MTEEKETPIAETRFASLLHPDLQKVWAENAAKRKKPTPEDKLAWRKSVRKMLAAKDKENG